MEDKKSDKEYLTSKEVCELYKISQTTLLRRIREDNIPFLQVGKARRFLKSDIDDWEARNMTQRED